MKLLDELWQGQGLGELRVIKEKSVEQRWYPAADARHLLGDAMEWDIDGWDCYAGVLPRTREKGTASATVSETRVLWADVDAKRTGGKWAGLAGIRMAKQQPSVIVDSGRGFHCYWFLREPVPFGIAQDAMKGLEREVQGDAVSDRSRVLRIPGTHNHKTTPPTPVRILYWDTERKYRIGDFATLSLPEERVDVGYGDVTLSNILALSDTPSWLYDLIRDGAPRGLRSETCFRAVIWMLRYGYSEEDIRETFRNTPDGIGNKYHEKGRDGGRWLNMTIRAARQAANEPR